MKIQLLVLLFTLSLPLFSQQISLTGKVEIDSSDSPFGQFIIYSLPDSALVKGSYIDSVIFQTQFDSKGSENFYVKISLAGYVDTLVGFSLNGNQKIDLGSIKMNNNRTLDAVDVVFIKPEFQRTMDGIKINVQGTTLQTLTSLFDVLVASPKLSSPDGEKIEIIGKGAPLILIDRQPIITVDELKAVPASQVESIEIITNPSAKYRAQGSGNGVIEVYTKNFALEGYNMNISTSGGINTQLKPTAALSAGINVKRKKFSLNGYMGANYDKSNSFGSSVGETTDDSYRSMNSNSTNERWNTWMYYQVKMAYQINENQKITSGVRGHGSFGSNESDSQTSYFDENTLETQQISASNSAYTWLNNSAFVNYTCQTDTNKSYLEINLNIIQKTSDQSGSSNNTYQNVPFGIYSDFSIKTESFDRPLIGELRLNYEHIFDTSGWKLNTGFSLSELRNGKIYNRYNLVDQAWAIDNQFSNSYDYQEHLGAIYTEVTKDWKKVSVRAGVTAEYTGLDGYSNSLQKQFIDSLYLIPFPSASILYQPNDKIGMTLSYSSGINRPQFSNYDPFIRVQDSLNISYGNPYLKPEISHSYGFQMDLFYAYSISVYYTDRRSPIADISFVNDSTFLTETTPWNAAHDKSLTVDLSVPFQFSWLQGWNSLWFSYNQYSFTPEFNRSPYSNMSYGMYSYLTFTLPKNFSLMNQLHVMRWGGAEYLTNTTTNWGMRLTKKFLNNDFQVFLDVQNIIPPKNRTTLYYGNYVYHDVGQWAFTSFKLGLYYKFGRLKQASQIKESNSGQSGRI